MHAQVAPREELLAGTPHDEVLAEQPGCNRSTVCKVRHESYGVPIVNEDWVINHRYSSSERARCDDATPPKMSSNSETLRVVGRHREIHLGCLPDGVTGTQDQRLARV
jgi:hypothetical protein